MANRMPHEVKAILENPTLMREDGSRRRGLPRPDDVQYFSLDDMIMYIINHLEDPLMHKDGDPHTNGPPYKEEGGYNPDIAKACAYALGEWFWTIFTAHGRSSKSESENASRCTRRVAPY